MYVRTFLCICLALSVSGCKTMFQKPFKKADQADQAKIKIKDDDTNFRAFLGRLRTAVGKKDLPVLASMMAPNFGYRWDTAPEGEDAFQYWDRNNLWGELQAVLKEHFVVHEDFMVAPPQVASDPNYTGYRAGMRTVGGSWKFVYFVGPEPR